MEMLNQLLRRTPGFYFFYPRYGNFQLLRREGAQRMQTGPQDFTFFNAHTELQTLLLQFSDFLEIAFRHSEAVADHFFFFYLFFFFIQNQLLR